MIFKLCKVIANNEAMLAYQKINISFTPPKLNLIINIENLLKKKFCIEDIKIEFKPSAKFLPYNYLDFELSLNIFERSSCFLTIEQYRTLCEKHFSSNPILNLTEQFADLDYFPNKIGFKIKDGLIDDKEKNPSLKDSLIAHLLKDPDISIETANNLIENFILIINQELQKPFYRTISYLSARMDFVNNTLKFNTIVTRRDYRQKKLQTILQALGISFFDSASLEFPTVVTTLGELFVKSNLSLVHSMSYNAKTDAAFGKINSLVIRSFINNPETLIVDNKNVVEKN